METGRRSALPRWRCRSYHLCVVASAGLPVSPTPLLGRAQELAALRELVVGAGARLVTITGPPGVGKTRLAAAVAREVADRFRDGAVWVDLAPVRDAELLPGLIFTAADGVDGARVRRLRAAMTDREVLVVLDNCEHLLDGMPALGGLLAGSPRLRILATSRQRLRLTGEREVPLPPLAMPSAAEVHDLARLAGNPAIALLLERAPANVRLTVQTARPLADVCIRLDGLPLALELAAARLRVFTPGELAFRLERRMSVLGAGARDVPPRHRDLRSAVAWSHDLLPERERVVFRRLSVLAGDWTIEAAEAVCGEDILAAVESLVEKSLVRGADTPGSTGRFQMLASVREFAAEQLDLHGEAGATAQRHRVYFAEAARQWETANGTEAETEGLQELGAVHADLSAAFVGAVDAADSATTLWLATGLGWYAYTRGALAGGERVVAAVHSAVHGIDDWEPVAAGLTTAGIVALGTGDLDCAERDLERAVALCEEHHDLRRLAIASAFCGHLARERGRLDEAASRYSAAREIYDRLGHVRGVAWAAHDLALVAIERADLAGAQVLLRDALRLFRDLDYEWAIGVTAGALASVLYRCGAVDEPAALFGEALGLHEHLCDGRGVAQCLEGLAEIALLRGAAATAARLRGAAITQRRLAGARPGSAERTHLDKLDAAIVAILGPAGADHERQAGRTMPAHAALRLAKETATAAAPSEVAADVGLTGRQSEVAGLVAAGNTNRQIARTLGISEKTVEVHIRNIMERLRTSSRVGIAAWAVSHGLRSRSTSGP